MQIISSRPHPKISAKLTWMNKVFQHGDRPWNFFLIAAAVFTLLLIFLIGMMLWNDSSLGREKTGIQFLLPTNDTNWDPVSDQFQAWPFIYGTLITSLVAILLAVPMGLGIAIFLSEICPGWLKAPIGLLVELLAAIPSVVFGLWGIFVFLPTVIQPLGDFLATVFGNIPGFSILFSGPISGSGSSRLAAGIILAIMIIPTIAAVSRDVLLSIPNSQREASLALGATQWETISKVLIPYGLSGILGAVILGLGRALGETMAVTMVIGNSIESSYSLLRPGYTLSSVIANEFAEAVSQIHSEVLIAAALILFGMTLALNTAARFLVWSVTRRNPQEVRS